MTFEAIVEAREDAKRQLSTLEEAVRFRREQRIKAESQGKSSDPWVEEPARRQPKRAAAR